MLEMMTRTRARIATKTIKGETLFVGFPLKTSSHVLVAAVMEKAMTTRTTNMRENLLGVH
jgi:hypothetical protein